MTTAAEPTTRAAEPAKRPRRVDCDPETTLIVVAVYVLILAVGAGIAVAYL